MCFGSLVGKAKVLRSLDHGDRVFGPSRHGTSVVDLAGMAKVFWIYRNRAKMVWIWWAWQVGKQLAGTWLLLLDCLYVT